MWNLILVLNHKIKSSNSRRVASKSRQPQRKPFFLLGIQTLIDPKSRVQSKNDTETETYSISGYIDLISSNVFDLPIHILEIIQMFFLFNKFLLRRTNPSFLRQINDHSIFVSTESHTSLEGPLLMLISFTLKALLESFVCYSTFRNALKFFLFFKTYVNLETFDSIQAITPPMLPYTIRLWFCLVLEIKYRIKLFPKIQQKLSKTRLLSKKATPQYDVYLIKRYRKKIFTVKTT